ncbi:uncharacterized protein PpBr36_10681 [Pyricularia pennisetigena]|uniref:uncharacterized protein n=1 Tax=Pyricularia pennisetigena TaxID=1578925 RepID=UPI0011509F1D|nr:uncharacterized protein PpBr36_10681 [Pyricularia pennisetigena]TLS20827.1 hypothetical protein PpBr36_10681 [Pyricularia pennisetigena]
MAIIKAADGTADPILTNLVNQDKVRFWKKPNLRRMYFFLFLCCMGVEMTSGFDSQLINTMLFTEPYLLYFGNGWRNNDNKIGIEPNLLGIMNASYNLGSILGVPLAPWFNHKFGRRWTILAGSIIMIVGALIQGFAQHAAMYIIARIILGIGIVFAIIAGAAMIGELAYPKERAMLTSLFNASWFIGAIVASAIAIETVNIKGEWAWRLPSLLQICPSLLQIATVFFLPESPRYLVSQDRDDEAFAILTKYHAEGDASSAIVQAEMAQIRTTIKLEMENSKQTWADVLKTAGMRRRFFITIFIGLFTQMSGNTLLSYYSSLLYDLMGYTETSVKTRINMADKCWGLINAVTLALIVVRFPRRRMYMLSAGSMLCAFTGMTVCFYHLRQATNAGVKNSSAGIAALFFFFAYGPCYNMGNNALTYTYLVELWPYAQRSRGIGVQQIFGKAGGFFSTYVNPIAINALDWRYFAIYCGWIGFEFIFIYLMYPETYGRTLEELTFLFEGKEYTDQANAAVQKQLDSDVTAVPQEKV